MITLKPVFFLLLFFSFFMTLLGIDKIKDTDNSMEAEKGKILIIGAVIFGIIDAIIGYNLFFNN